MSLRKGVLLRSHRKSISEMDMKTRNANTLDGTYTKEKKETKKIIEKDEASPQKQSKHNKSKTKSKETKKQHHQQQQQQQNNRETSIPIAQSTLIHTPVATAKEKKLSISMIDESGIDFLKNENQNEKTLIEMALEDGDDEKQEKPTDEKNRNKENKMPVSSQENIDSLMEYKYKVERLCGILGQFQEQHHEVVNNYQKVIKENKESREKLNLTLFELESDKYLLQQNVQELTEENLKKSTEIESLKQRIEELEKERAEHMEKEQQRECEETERLKALELEREKEEQERKEKEEKEEKEKAQRNITASSLDISETLATLPSDAKFSRTRRKSLLTETIIALSLPDAEKIDLYEDIILDQQDVLDFYSILCGTSVYKPKQTNTTASSPNTTPSKRGRPKKKKNDDEESVKNEFEYHCRVQQRNKPLEDYPFTFKLNMHLREVKYIPCKDESLFNTFKEHLPCNLQTSLTHDADEAYLFLKELITKVGESAT